MQQQTTGKNLFLVPRQTRRVSKGYALLRRHHSSWDLQRGLMKTASLGLLSNATTFFAHLWMNHVGVVNRPLEFSMVQYFEGSSTEINPSK